MKTLEQDRLERVVFGILNDHLIILTPCADGSYLTSDKPIRGYSSSTRMQRFRSLVAVVDHYKPILLDQRLTKLYN